MEMRVWTWRSPKRARFSGTRSAQASRGAICFGWAALGGGDQGAEVGSNPQADWRQKRARVTMHPVRVMAMRTPGSRIRSHVKTSALMGVCQID
jgi:hypothetical protein